MEATFGRREKQVNVLFSRCPKPAQSESSQICVQSESSPIFFGAGAVLGSQTKSNVCFGADLCSVQFVFGANTVLGSEIKSNIFVSA